MLAVEDPEDREEQVDDVEIQADSGGNLLLDMVLPQDHLRVDEDIRAEHQRREPAPQQLPRARPRQESRHEPKDQQAPQRAEQIRHPAGEVVLRLAGESREKDEDADGDEEGVEDEAGVVQGDDDGDGVGLEGGEAGEEEEVGGVGLALPVGEAEEDHGADEGGPDEPWVRLDPGLVGGGPEGGGGDGGRGNELNGEDGVDLADEGVADVDGGFGY